MKTKILLVAILLAAVACLHGCVVHDPGYYSYGGTYYSRPYSPYYYSPYYPYYYRPYYPYYYGTYLYSPFWFGGYYFHGDSGHKHGGGGHRHGGGGQRGGGHR